MRNSLITHCPVCGTDVNITQIACPDCETKVEGNFGLPPLARLPKELQQVVVVFVRCRGNFREVERELGLSYPTVSKKLDAVNLFLEAIGAAEDSDKAKVLRRVDAGEIDVREAVEILKKQQAKPV